MCSGILNGQISVEDTTTLVVPYVNGINYKWEIYCQNVDFSKNRGVCGEENVEFLGEKDRESVKVKFKKEGIYFFRVIASDGCSDNIKIGKLIIKNHAPVDKPDLKIDEKNQNCNILFYDMKIPNAISIDNDYKNDTWEIPDLKDFCIKCEKSNKLLIFNRWGAKVYEKENYMIDEVRFSGYSENSITINKEKKLPKGVYYYVITLSDGSVKKGWLYIMN